MVERYEYQQAEEARQSGWFGWMFGGLLVLALVLLGVSLVNNRAELADNRVTQNSSAFYGQKVNLTGQVNDVYGIQAFSLNGSGLINNAVLILSRSPLVPMGGGGDDVLYQNGDRVNVQGTVKPFHINEVEQELGVDLVDSMFLGWEGKPVVIADHVDKTQ